MIAKTLIAAGLTVTLSVSAPAAVADQQPRSGCKDKTALMLKRAGFTGEKNRIAWAITWRESKHKNLNESSRWYTGALGLWQIQSSAHQGKPWWSRSAMLNPQRQSRLVYLHLSQRGTNWAHWGLNRNGTAMNTMYYGRWSSWQHHNWIWRPYQQGRALYPKACLR